MLPPPTFIAIGFYPLKTKPSEGNESPLVVRWPGCRRDMRQATRPPAYFFAAGAAGFAAAGAVFTPPAVVAIGLTPPSEAM